MVVRSRTRATAEESWQSVLRSGTHVEGRRTALLRGCALPALELLPVLEQQLSAWRPSTGSYGASAASG